MRKKLAVTFAVTMTMCTLATTALAMTGGANQAGRYYYATQWSMKTACRC